MPPRPRGQCSPPWLKEPPRLPAAVPGGPAGFALLVRPGPAEGIAVVPSWPASRPGLCAYIPASPPNHPVPRALGRCEPLVILLIGSARRIVRLTRLQRSIAPSTRLRSVANRENTATSTVSHPQPARHALPSGLPKGGGPWYRPLPTGRCLT